MWGDKDREQELRSAGMRRVHSESHLGGEGEDRFLDKLKQHARLNTKVPSVAVKAESVATGGVTDKDMTNIIKAVIDEEPIVKTPQAIRSLTALGCILEEAQKSGKLHAPAQDRSTSEANLRLGTGRGQAVVDSVTQTPGGYSKQNCNSSKGIPDASSSESNIAETETTENSDQFKAPGWNSATKRVGNKAVCGVDSGTQVTPKVDISEDETVMKNDFAFGTPRVSASSVVDDEARKATAGNEQTTQNDGKTLKPDSEKENTESSSFTGGQNLLVGLKFNPVPQTKFRIKVHNAPASGSSESLSSTSTIDPYRSQNIKYTELGQDERTAQKRNMNGKKSRFLPKRRDSSASHIVDVKIYEAKPLPLLKPPPLKPRQTPSIFEEVKRPDYQKMRSDMAKAVDHSDLVQLFCDKLARLGASTQDFDYYASKMQATAAKQLKDLPIAEMPEVPAEDHHKYTGDQTIKNITLKSVKLHRDIDDDEDDVFVTGHTSGQSLTTALAAGALGLPDDATASSD